MSIDTSPKRLRELADRLYKLDGVIDASDILHALADEKEAHQPYMQEDQLPASITDKEYREWFKKSWILFGVRVGPIFPLKPADVPLPMPCAGETTMKPKRAGEPLTYEWPTHVEHPLYRLLMSTAVFLEQAAERGKILHNPEVCKQLRFWAGEVDNISLATVKKEGL